MVNKKDDQEKLALQIGKAVLAGLQSVEVKQKPKLATENVTSAPKVILG